MVDQAIQQARNHPITPKAIIAPHAGYKFSGGVCGQAYRPILNRSNEIERVILIGPNHRMPLKGMAVASQGFWATPLGPVAIDWPSIQTVLEDPAVTVNDAPFAGEHGLEVHLPFLIRSLAEFKVVPILVGTTAIADVARVLRKLWGGPETLIVVSSDLSHFLEYDTAVAKDKATLKQIETLANQGVTTEQACGWNSVNGMTALAQHFDLRPTVLQYQNSGDTAGGKDRVVGYGSVAYEYARSATITDNARSSLTKLARQVLGSALENNGNMPKLEIGGVTPELAAHRATFVTLNLDGKLRGCIGSMAPHRSLVEDVATNAYKAGFGDPRFPKLTKAEAARVEVHVSILSTPRVIKVSNDQELCRSLAPDQDGLIFHDGNHRSLFLPSVWESLPKPEAFIGNLKRKAGLAPDHWSANTRWFRFSTESFGD